MTEPNRTVSPESLAITTGYASTDLSKELLTKLQTEIKGYKRNKNSSGAIFLQSHVAYEAIIALIKKVDAHSENLDSLPWDEFDKSATSITELEKFLLELLFEDHDQELILPESAELEASVQFVKTWLDHHAAAIKRANTLDTWVFETAKLKEETERTGFKHKLVKGQRNDHTDTVESIDKEIGKSKLLDTDILREESDKTDYVKEVKAAVTSLSTEVKSMAEKLDYPEEQAGKVVAGVMLLHVPFVVSQLADNNAKTQEHIRSVKIWDAAKKFAEYLLGFLKETSDKKNDLSADKKTELDVKYDGFEKLLLGISDLGGWIPAILSMMRLAAQVRRPFYGRSVALVKMWFTMNKNVEMKNENGADERTALVSAIGETKKAFTKAKDDITAFDAATMADKITEVEKSYSSVHATVTLFVKKYAPTDEVALETAYTDAKKVDDEHLQKFRAKLTFKAPAPAAVATDTLHDRGNLDPKSAQQEEQGRRRSASPITDGPEGQQDEEENEGSQNQGGDHGNEEDPTAGEIDDVESDTEGDTDDDEDED
ncbi:hypothetical protein BKA70DRAFT_1395809 [Coprinopsis sp. MPI-PUGE-AT-0042]|nr:hypothetical protein BKA70DRAFT_1395809 [Coprinopsis sp. MPI-PUGE-AT-0042]